MLNQITIMGRLVRDPDVRYTQSQIPVASFTVAVDRDFKSQDSNERQTDFIDCVAWRSQADFISKYFNKGSMVIVTGRLQIRDWTDRDGNKRRSAEIVAENIHFGESKRRDSDPAPAYGGGSYGNAGSSYSGAGSSYSGAGASYSGTSTTYSGNSSYSAPAPAAMPNNGFTELAPDDGELPF